MREERMTLEGNYNLFTVFLAIVVGILSAYTALDLIERSSSSPRPQKKWVLMSALSFGLGVWAVQVIGLLSYYTPITFQINMWMLIASLLVAFLGSLLSSWLYMIKKMSIISGILIGITLLMTHYILLFSLKSNIALQVQPWASLLSATISFVLGAYIVHAWFYVKTLEQNQMMKVMSSIVTGCGLAAMHYIHLAGYSLKEGTFIIRRWGQFLPYQEPFAGLVASVTLTILILFLLIAAYKKHAESHTNMIKEASYRSLFNYNPDIVCSISVNGFINVMNTKGKDVTGYAMHEMEHLPFLMLFPPDDAERIQHFFQQSLDGTSVHYDATLIKQNGENIYVEVTQMPIIVNGESHGIYVILKDITERKVAQEALCTLQSELALTMNQHDGVIFKLKKVNGKFLYTMSEGKLKKGFGLDTDEMVGKAIDMFLEGKQLQEKHNLYEKVWNGQALSYEGFFRGIPYYETLTPVIKGDQVVEIIGNMIDITNLHRAQVQLERSEAMYRSVLSTMTEGVVFHNCEGDIVAANEHAASILGMSYDEFYQINTMNLAWRMIHPNGEIFQKEDIPSVRCLKTGKAVENVVMGIWVTPHKLIWLSINAQRLSDNEYHEGVVVTFKDITKQRQQEVELLQINKRLTIAKEEAEKANQTKTEFLSKVSHELRTPLNSIMGYTQILGDQELPPIQTGHVQKIMRASQHLLNLINETMDLSKIEGGHVSLNMESLSVQQVLEEAYKTMHPIALEHNMNLTLLQQQPDVYVYGDNLRLQQILLNLLTNAVRYSKPYGSIKLAFKSDEHVVTIYVEDEGIGISSSEIQDIFKPFYRSKSVMIDGTGIGLSLVKQLVLIMDGTYGVESVEGIGSTFWVQFPVVKASDKSPSIKEKSVLQSIASIEKASVLYIEDYDENIELMQSVLAPYNNVELFIAKNGRQGIEAIQTIHPKVILLDMNLPDISGEEVVKAIKSQDQLKDIPVIAVTANALQGDVEKAVSMGIEEYITKPIHIETFLHKLARILNVKK